jgi:hypothetical protein
VRSVPRFVFLRPAPAAPGGYELLDQFATRDKAKVAAAILAYAPPGNG